MGFSHDADPHTHVLVYMCVSICVFHLSLRPTKTGCYMLENADEYFAEGCQTWFDATVRTDVNGGINTREKIKQHDPDFAQLLAEVREGEEEGRSPSMADRRPVRNHTVPLCMRLGANKSSSWDASFTAVVVAAAASRCLVMARGVTCTLRRLCFTADVTQPDPGGEHMHHKQHKHKQQQQQHSLVGHSLG